MIAAPILGEKKEVSASRALSVGKFESDSMRLPLDANLSTVYLSRESWPDTGGNVVEVKKWFSFDNGATWEPGGSATYAGGVYTHRDGTVMTDATLSIYSVPQPKNSNRLVKIEVNPLVPLTTKISIQAKQAAAK